MTAKRTDQTWQARTTRRPPMHFHPPRIFGETCDGIIHNSPDCIVAYLTQTIENRVSVFPFLKKNPLSGTLAMSHNNSHPPVSEGGGGSGGGSNSNNYAYAMSFPSQHAHSNHAQPIPQQAQSHGYPVQNNHQGQPSQNGPAGMPSPFRSFNETPYSNSIRSAQPYEKPQIYTASIHLARNTIIPSHD